MLYSEPLEWRIILSLSYMLNVKHIFPVDLMTKSILIGCLNTKTTSHTGMLIYLLFLSRLRMHEWIIACWCRFIKEKCTVLESNVKRSCGLFEFQWEKGLPLRRANEVFGFLENGNFLGLLELLAQFDDFLTNHIR